MILSKSDVRHHALPLWLAPAAVLVFAPAASAQPLYESAVVGQTPIHYWRLNEATGTTAGARVGAVTGTYMSATIGQAGPRPPAFPGFEAGNNAVSFDGVDDSIDMATSLLNNRAALSMTGWFFQTAPQGTTRVGLWGQNDAVEFGFINPDGIQFWTPGGGNVTATYDQGLNNTWVHVAGVANGTDIRIYINGALIVTGGVATTDYGTSTEPFRIGGGGIFDTAGTNGNFFTGMIDEVTIFDRALTPAEVQAQFLAATAIPEPATWLLTTAGMLGTLSALWRSRRCARTGRGRDTGLNRPSEGPAAVRAGT
jgi:hypothetical protein